MIDLNNNGVISKANHQQFFEAIKDPTGAIIAFTAIDEDMDEVITCDDIYTDVKADMKFYFNFTDETKCSNYFFGPLVKI